MPESPYLTGNASVLIERFLTAVDEVASVTCAVKLNVPAVVGVPDISPVELLRFSAFGSDPALIDQLYGSIPPVAVRVWLYGTRTVPEGRDAVVIVSEAATAKEAFTVQSAVIGFVVYVFPSKLPPQVPDMTARYPAFGVTVNEGVALWLTVCTVDGLMVP